MKMKMEIDFDNLGDYSVDELESINGELNDLRKKIYKEIEKKTLPNVDFTGKYVKSNLGYMFVNWQTYDEVSPYNDSRMFFQGVGFSGSVGGHYKDSSYFDYDALKEWYIPIESYKRDLESGEIMEITKEEFFGELRKYKEMLFSEIEEWIEKSEEDSKNQMEPH